MKSHLGRSSQGIHQKDNVPTQQMDDWPENIKTSNRIYWQRIW
jgi:hypothetical protein